MILNGMIDDGWIWSLEVGEVWMPVSRTVYLPS
jgi:hypothetical protein